MKKYAVLEKILLSVNLGEERLFRNHCLSTRDPQGSRVAALKRASLQIRGQILGVKMGITPAMVLAVASTTKCHLKQLFNRSISDVL